MHFCTIDAPRARVVQKRTYTVRFCTLTGRWIRVVQKCTPRPSPRCRRSTAPLTPFGFVYYDLEL